MAPGVQFTKSSADRIADTVRSVEGRPFPENKLQRRRSGAGSRSTLWQITAVQTGPETCTIQRVENQDDDLNAASEKTDILYDTENEPAVDDQGLLIRLGDGSLFFFRKVGVETAAVIHRLSENAIVKNDSPDTTFDYNSADGYIHAEGPIFVKTIDHRFVVKFDTPITAGLPPTPGTQQMGYLQFGMEGGSAGATFQSRERLNLDDWEVDYSYGLEFIREDFDCSAITWNVLDGLDRYDLTEIKAATQVRVEHLVLAHPTNPNAFVKSYPQFGKRFPYYQTYDSVFDTVYGMVLYLHLGSTGTRNWAFDYPFKTGQPTPATATNWYWLFARYL